MDRNRRAEKDRDCQAKRDRVRLAEIDGRRRAKVDGGEEEEDKRIKGGWETGTRRHRIHIRITFIFAFPVAVAFCTLHPLVLGSFRPLLVM